MSDKVTSDPASPTAPPTAPKLHRSRVNRAIQNYITDAETFLTTVATDLEIQPAMEAHGYDAAELALGNTKLQAAAEAFGVRLQSMGGKTEIHEDLKSDEQTARDDYAAFREVARAAFPKQSDRVGLGLTGNVPHDLQKFITLAHTSYTNAAKAEWTGKMTKRGYPPARLTTLNDAVTDLTGTESQKAIATGEAQQSTEARDDAYSDLKDYMKEIMGVARGVFRNNAGALTKMKL